MFKIIKKIIYLLIVLMLMGIEGCSNTPYVPDQRCVNLLSQADRELTSARTDMLYLETETRAMLPTIPSRGEAGIRSYLNLVDDAFDAMVTVDLNLGAVESKIKSDRVQEYRTVKYSSKKRRQAVKDYQQYLKGVDMVIRGLSPSDPPAEKLYRVMRSQQENTILKYLIKDGCVSKS
jgi:hypothetical protein